MLNFIKKYKHIFWMLIILANSIFYFVTAFIPFTRHPIYCSFDGVIPFIPAFIVPYVIWYVYVPLLMLWPCFTNKSAFLKQIKLMIFGLIVVWITFLVYPTCITFRPANLGSGFFNFVCKIVFSADDAVNVMPSLHCFETLIVHFGAFTFGPYKNKIILRVASAITAFLICISTVFVKQHSILDSIAGCALALVVCLIYEFIEKRTKHDN